MFNNVLCHEYEANIFAAEYLLTDEDVMDALYENQSLFEVAKKLKVPAEILNFKIIALNNKGHRINTPLSSDICFMKKHYC